MQYPSVLIIGGGISGITAALGLARRGIAVNLVEREPVLGGNALHVCCKAVNGLCQQCGGCLFAERLRDVQLEALVNVYTSSTVHGVLPKDGAYRYQLASPAGEQAFASQAVIVATGFDHVDARTKGPYGYGILPMVISGEDMERRLKSGGQAVFDTAEPREVAFIQCVGSRDEHAGRGWCSQVCCRYGVRLARLLKARSPQTNVTVFKMDIQTNGRDSQAFGLAQKEGIQFICGLPAVVRRAHNDANKASLLFDDITTGQFRELAFDLVVLATGIEPRADTAQVTEMLGIERNRFGFIAADINTNATTQQGVFTAGCCQSPRSIAESIAHATLTANACYEYLGRQA